MELLTTTFLVKPRLNFDFLGSLTRGAGIIEFATDCLFNDCLSSTIGTSEDWNEVTVLVISYILSLSIFSNFILSCICWTKSRYFCAVGCRSCYFTLFFW